MFKHVFDWRRLVAAALALIVTACGAPSTYGGSVPAARSGDAVEWPAGIRQAATDPAWAAKVMESLASKHVTTGRLHFNSSGAGYTLTSGQDDDYKSAKEFFVDKGVVKANTPQVAEHVEAKAAWIVWQKDKTFSVLVINNEDGLCDYASRYGCVEFLPKMLPPESAMVVWHPLKEGGVAREEIVNHG